MKVKFYSEDGMMFDTRKECLEHENEIEAARLEAEKKEVEDAWEHYKNLLNKYKYVDDYKIYSSVTEAYEDDYPFLNALFKAFDLI